MKKIIYLSPDYFEQRDYERFGVDILKRSGFQTEIWTVHSIIYNKELHKPKNIYTGKIHNITSIKEFKKELLKRIKKDGICMFFMLTANREIEIKLRCLVKIYGHNYCNFYINPFLSEDTIGKNYQDIYFDKKRSLYDFLFPSTFNFVSTKKNFIKFPNKYETAKKKTVLIHTLDYDLFLKNRSKKPLIATEYLLFADEAYTHHTDYEKENIPNPMKGHETEYYEELNNLFSHLEKIYHCEVIIAAHPRAEYDGHEFHNRKIIYYQTEQLIRNSKFVITYASNSINFVILHKKPFLFIYHSWIKRAPEWKSYYVPYLKYFSAPAFNASEDYTEQDLIQSIHSVNPSSYKKYMKEYIKSKHSKNGYFFQVVADTLKV